MDKNNKHKVPAVGNDTKGGKSAMSKMDPQQPDEKITSFKGIRIHDKGPDSWGIGQRGK